MPRSCQQLARCPSPYMDMPLRPEMLRWAQERVRLDVETLAKRIGASPSGVQRCERRV